MAISPEQTSSPVNTAGDAADALLDNRTQNERDILTLIRHEGAIPKSEIALRTGLSAQSATVIIKKLASDKLVQALAPVRGGVGQPKVPFGLNPNGAFGLGLKIGRRSFDMTLLDLAGNVKASLHEKVPYPTVAHLLSFTERGVTVLTQQLSAEQRTRIRGLGVAMPFEIWNWAEEAGAPTEALEAWKNLDIQASLSAHLGFPIFVSNDATAACSAEMAFGNHHRFNHFLYVFVGTFLGGGLIINNQLFTGKSGNAGAIGSLPFVTATNNQQQQLIAQSSLYLLEKQLHDAGFDGNNLYDAPDHWPGLKSDPKVEKILTLWLEQAAEGIAFAAHCAFSMLDLDGIIIDGAMPQNIKNQLVDYVQSALKNADLRGISPGSVSAGQVGSKAQSIGSANLSLIANYY
ncbi:ROK family transcriptional regulator [Alteromonas sp. 1_MG-2023]|uniref:ROK family transcriptional regulator n=1 Tax=Alteromonas sp. 1_MG-2023 TaxID=3062669 RepID=UPI0026E1FC4E|nr:ROK family transcriptional regulator [Alteromonas sp. 1_MG-2023]MDO6568563.1 ROK family transcriptional regulator [Alteromonas sp. 1_MG-2023]